MKVPEVVKSNKRISILVALLAVFMISGASLLLNKHDRSVDATKKSLEEKPVVKPSTSTKLTFQDVKKLPKTYRPGEKLTIFFVIENREGKTIDYSFVVNVNGKVAAAHPITIKNKVSQTVEQAFELPKDQQKITVEVKLPDQAKTISFSMERAK